MAFRLLRPKPIEAPHCPAVTAMSKIKTAPDPAELQAQISAGLTLQVSTATLTREFSMQMASKGFGILDKEMVDKAAWASGKWPEGKPTGVIQDKELVFNLGLNRGRSNFFVFMKQEDRYIEIFYTNPRSDEVSLSFTPEDIYAKRRITVNEMDYQKKMARIVDEILDTARGKFPEDMRMQTHFHAGRLFDESWKVTDDGASNLADLLRKAMLYHLDFFGYTPHNSSHYSVHCALDAVCKAIGLTYVPGLELTGSRYAEDKNGPHIILMFDEYGRDTTEWTVKKEILKNRRGLDMISYFQGMDFEDMQKVLQRLRQEHRLLMIYAHPMNNAAEAQFRQEGRVKIGHVGLWSAVDDGVYTLDEAMELLGKSDGQAAWNVTLSNARIIVRDQGLLALLWPLLKKYQGGEALTANAVNLATSRKTEFELRKSTIFESDEHDTTPLEHEVAGHTIYGTGGDGFVKGFTRVLLTPETYGRLVMEGRNLTAKELVRMVSLGQAKLHAKVFAVDNKGTLEIPKGRTERPHYTRLERYWLKIKQVYQYAVALVKDAVYFAKNREFKHLFHMDA